MLVLVDDIFRGQDAAEAFIDLPPDLPMTILATSRRNEFRSRAKRLKCESVEFQLNPPSVTEKEKILENLGKSRADLTVDQTRRLEQADQFIVLMIEMVGGKELHEVIRDTINTLYNLEPNHSAFRAYAYLCFAGQFGISMPATLLEKLDREFSGLKGRPVIEGLIFADDRRDFLRSGHSVLAKTASDIYTSEKGYTPNRIIRDLVSVTDNSSRLERNFVVHLFIAVANSQLINTDLLFMLTKEFASKCVANAELLVELTNWRAFYTRCRQLELAEKCVDLAINRELAREDDPSLLLFLYRERGNEMAALPPIKRWIKDRPDQGNIRPAYFALVEKYARDDIPSVIQETDRWLDKNQTDTWTREKFLLFVDRNRPDLIGQHLRKTKMWLDQHPENGQIRVTYLRLVERHGTIPEIHEAIVSVGKWLDQNPDYSFVRAAYLGLVERYENTQEVNESILKADNWLAKPENTNDIDTRTALLGLLRRRWAVNCQAKNSSDELLQKKGIARKTPSFEQILETNIEWVKQHPAAKEIWTVLLGLLFSIGRKDEAVKLISEALSHHPDDQNILIQNQQAIHESEMPLEEAKRTFESLMKRSPMSKPIKLMYAAWLRDQCQHEEADAFYSKLIDEYPNAYEPRFGLAQHYLNVGLFNEAAEQFDKVVKMRLGYRHQMAHAGLGQALWKLGKKQEAENELGLAIKWAEKKKQPAAMFRTLLGRFYLDHKKWDDAIKAFRAAKEEDPKYFGNYWGIGQALLGLGKFPDAADALRKAIELQPDLDPPASDEIKALIDQCQQRLQSTK